MRIRAERTQTDAHSTTHDAEMDRGIEQMAVAESSQAGRQGRGQSLRRSLSVAALAVAGLASCAQGASAATLSVDDDRAQCPVADYTDLNQAVAAAAQGDEVYVCAGTYAVPGGAQSAGLRIEKNVDLLGAGADQVFIQPDGSSASMAGPNPSERDEFGNVITVKRRLIQLFDIELSGFTVRSPNTAVEAGIAMVDVTEGSIHDVRIENLAPGSSAYSSGALAGQGHGLVLANTIEDVQNEIDVSDVDISGFNKAGIVVDNRLRSGTAPVGNGSRIIADVAGTTIEGAGFGSTAFQDGIQVWGIGASLDLANSLISGTGNADSSSAAVLLRGAGVVDSVIGGDAASTNDLSGNDFGISNRTFDGSGLATDTLEATRNYFGPLGPGQSQFVATSNVRFRPTAGSALAPPAGPGEVADAAPNAEWDTVPAEGEELEVDQSYELVALAGDDFGVTEVEFFADGTSLGVSPTPALNGDRTYSATYTPTLADSGKTVSLSALVTDSKGQTAILTRTVTIEDAIVPETAIDSGPGEGTVVADSTVRFSFSADEPSAFECSVDGATFSACSSPFTTPELADGPHSFAVRATDGAGNVDASPASRSFRVDSTPPQTILSKKPKKVTRSKLARFTFSSVASPDDPYAENPDYQEGGRFQCSLDGERFKACSSPAFYSVERGKHLFRVRAVDQVGNADATPARYMWRVKRG